MKKTAAALAIVIALTLSGCSGSADAARQHWHDVAVSYGLDAPTADVVARALCTGDSATAARIVISKAPPYLLRDITQAAREIRSAAVAAECPERI